jgi:LysM repeat protein
MNCVSRLALTLVCMASLSLASASPAPQQTTILGEHHVAKGDSLYCIGRAYGVVPSAIAAANGLSKFARLRIGQVLKIPSVQWVNIPPGPVCVAQFRSPFPGGSAVTPAPTPTLTTAPCNTRIYTVQRGDTLSRLMRRFGVTVAALKAANGLTGDTIYAGQVLCIPDALSSVPPSGSTPSPGRVVISSIRFDGAVVQVESDEYAVITNAGGTAVNLGGWRLNAGDAGQSYTFPSFDLKTGQSCRVYTNESHADTCGFSFGISSAIWNNAGDCGYLYDAQGHEAHRYCYA